MKYFIAYIWEEKNGFGCGNTSLECKKINSIQDIREIEKLITDTLGVDAVYITNWRKF